MPEAIRAYSRGALDVARAYVATSVGPQPAPELFAGVRRYCGFLGAPRSGHSVVAALLDAHPNAAIADGAAALRLVHARFGRLRLYRTLVRNSRTRARSGRPAGGYRYPVAGQWQGAIQHLHVIGDKQAEGVALRLRARPWLLDRLRATVGVPLRFVVVVRNPFDTIATMALRAAGRGRPDVEAAARRYLELSETVERVRAELEPEELRELRHESFVAEPKAALRDLCGWLDLTPSETYLDACASIVSPSPHRSRHAVPWEARTRRDVERAIGSLPALRGYDFDD